MEQPDENHEHIEGNLPHFDINTAKPGDFKAGDLVIHKGEGVACYLDEDDIREVEEKNAKTE